jgi:hypothetical protein
MATAMYIYFSTREPLRNPCALSTNAETPAGGVVGGVASMKLWKAAPATDTVRFDSKHAENCYAGGHPPRLYYMYSDTA